LSLLNDVIFKIVFGSEPNAPVLRALLNALLELSGDGSIVELELLNPGLDRERLGQKGVILDLKARDGRGRLYNIEVQVTRERDYILRALYYLARLFGGQLEPGQPYSELAKTIGISVLDFTLFPALEDFHSCHRFHDAFHGFELSDAMELHFLELPKFRSAKPLGDQTRFEQWLHVLKFSELYIAPGEPVPPELAREEGIEMALNALKRACASDEVRELVEMREKASHDWASWLQDAELRGLEKGLEKGRQEGVRETARRMRLAGMSAETIAQVTGLSLEELGE
jgi:predicted transposase/invertase (TIGR01784 family)